MATERNTTMVEPVDVGLRDAVSTRRRLLLSPLWFLVALATVVGVNATSAAASSATETRVRAIEHITVDIVAASSGETAGSVGCLRPSQPGSASGSCVATNNGQFWPDTPEELDAMLGITGRRVPDGPTTPGRGKVIWDLPSGKRITYEAHPYHTDAPSFHREPHYHVDQAGASNHSPSGRRLPGDPFDC
jgi:hypothetical protein